MRFRTLTTKLPSVSEIGFGVWTVATNWWGIKEPSIGIQLLREARSQGINLFDTADVYGEGFGETILAEAFGNEITQLVIATKVGYDWEGAGPRSGHSELPQEWSPSFIRSQCEKSLTRLHRDWIDLYQLHNPRLEVAQSEDLLATLQDLQHEGKIRDYAAALGPDIGWFQEGRAALERGYPALQVIYSLLEQEPTASLIPLAEARGTTFMVRVPHASGLLDGSYRPERHFDKSDHRSHRKELWMRAGLDAVEDLKRIVDSRRILAQAALQFCLAPPSVATVLPNLTQGGQIREFLGALEAPPLSPHELLAISTLWNEKLADQLRQPFADSSTKPTPQKAA